MKLARRKQHVMALSLRGSSAAHACHVDCRRLDLPFASTCATHAVKSIVGGINGKRDTASGRICIRTSHLRFTCQCHRTRQGLCDRLRRCHSVRPWPTLERDCYRSSLQQQRARPKPHPGNEAFINRARRSARQWRPRPLFRARLSARSKCRSSSRLGHCARCNRSRSGNWRQWPRSDRSRRGRR